MGLTEIDKKIERLEMEIKNAKAARSLAARKERSGHLIALGVLMEQIYKTATPEQRASLKEKARKLLDGRNKDRALEGLDQLTNEFDLDEVGDIVIDASGWPRPPMPND